MNNQNKNNKINSVDIKLANRIIEFMNDLLKYDRPAIAAMIVNHVPCNLALSDHPTVQTSIQHGGFHIGLLGLLNGLCGIYKDGYGPITAVFSDEKNSQGLYDLIKFRSTRDS